MSVCSCVVFSKFPDLPEVVSPSVSWCWGERDCEAPGTHGKRLEEKL